MGKTYIFSRKAVDHMVKFGKPIIVVSLTEDQAMIIIAMALNYMKEKYPKLIGKGKWKPQTKKLFIMRKGKPVPMISRPVGNTGDATRGFEGGVLIVDEASRMPKLFWIAAKPVLLTCAGELWMCSTPHGKRGYFWESFKDKMIKKNPKARFEVFYKNTEDVMNDRKISEGWTKEQREGALRILEEDKREMSVLEYGQEYQGKFMEDLKQFFSDELIRSCQTEERRREILGLREYYLGVDIARLGRDSSTFEVIDRTNKKGLVHVENIVTKKTLTTESTNIILKLEDDYKFKQIFVDAYGVGIGVFDQLLSDDRTKRKTIAIGHWARPLDSEEKKKRKITPWDIYLNLRVLMEEGKIKLLKGDDIFSSLKSIQCEQGDGDKEPTIFGSDKHIADGLAFASWCSQDKSLNIWIC